MSNTLTLVYAGTVTVLFFFWIYGIVSFVRDLKNTFMPGAKQYLRGRRRQKEKEQKEREREERRNDLL